MNENKNKLVVFHIITKLELGGAQKVTLQTLTQLDKKRFSCGLITGDMGELVEEAKKMEDISKYFLRNFKHPIQPIYDFKALLEIRRILKSNKVDVVHTHSSKAGIVGRWAAFFAGVPIRVHSVHGWSFNDYQNKLKKYLFIFLEKLAALITTHFFIETDLHIRIGRKLNLLKKDNFSRLLPGIDFSDLDKIRSQKKPGIPDDLNLLRKENKFLITKVACFKPQKAPLDFIRAAKKVTDKMKDIYFLLVGDGHLKDEILQEISSLNMEDNITLTGWRHDIPEILKVSDLIVLTSLWEGMPTIIPMAMRMSVPVIANDIDGCRELITHKNTGLLSTPGDIDSIASNIIIMLKDNKLYEKIAENSHKLTIDFEVNRTVKQQEKIYSELLAKSGN